MPHPPESRTRAVRVMMCPVKVLGRENDVSDQAHDPHATGDAGPGAHDAHAAVPLGPIDWPAWATAALGGALAVIVAAALAIAAHP